MPRQHFAESNHSAVVLVVGPREDVLLVIEHTKPLPHYWKCPGGEGEGAETPLQTALREVKEETGIPLDPANVVQIGEPVMLGEREHHKYHFLARVSSWKGLLERGDEGEEVREWQLSMLGRLNILPPQWKFWSAHRAQLAAHGVLLPFSREEGGN